MADIERIATSASAGMHRTVGKLSQVVIAALVVTLVIGAATFATGWWVFDGSAGWAVVGGIICAAPFVAAVVAWWFVRATASRAGRLVTDLHTFLSTSGEGAAESASLIIDAETGRTIGVRTGRSFRGLRQELVDRRRELPALFAGVRAIASVPGLAAIAVLGTLFVGALGTILLIGGLID